MAALDWIVLSLWLLTFINTLINIALIPKLRPRAPIEGPLISIIIPARNEESAIERTVRAFLAQTYRAIEVIVVNDRSTDSTGAILASVTDERLTVITGVEPPPGWLGKPWALHQGSQSARGEILLFVDADIVYAPEGVAAAFAEMRRSGAAMLTTLPNIVMQGFWEKVAMPQLAVFAFSFIPAWLSNRSRAVLLGVGGGTGNMIARADYEAIGGHESLRNSVVDDVALARLVRRFGHRTIAVRGEDFVSVRMYRGLREIVHGFTKNSFAVMNRSYVLTLIIAVLAVVCHVLPYLRALTGHPAAIATVAVITMTRLIVFISLRYSIAAALFAHPLMVLVWTWISLRSMWKTGVRRELAWRGRTYDAAETRFGAER